MSTKRPASTSTSVIHEGRPRFVPGDGVPVPIAQTSTFVFRDTAELVSFFEGTHADEARGEYGRYGNPTTNALEARLAALEGADEALAFASGMAAMTTTILALVKSGQHVVLFKDGYRKTRDFVTKTLARFGVASTVVAPGDLAELEAAMRAETKLVIGEAPTNPYLRCADLEAVAAVVKRTRGAKLVVDATLASPLGFRPLEHGADLSVQSATKYLAGHHDVLGGCVAGSRDVISLVRELRGATGATLDPHAAFLIARGLDTLALRMERHEASGAALAAALEGHPNVLRVHHPSLASHPDHATAQRLFRGVGGVVSFVHADGLDGARRVCDRARIARIGPSFGGPQTLIEPVALMSYFEQGPEGRAALGIEEGLVRVACGLEEPSAIVDDILAALA
jgi:cystathionine gamma-synthase